MHPARGPLCLPIVLLLLVLLPRSWTFNLKEESPSIFTGPPASYFGLTVKLHRTSSGARLLVGSPRANTTFESSVAEPGGLFYCDLSAPLRSSGSCVPYRLDSSGDTAGGSNPDAYKDRKAGQWMGVALDATQGANGSVITCGHRWINHYYANHHLINGACYVMDAEMRESSIERLLPLIHQTDQFPILNGQASYGFAYGQAGISAALSPRNTRMLAVGAPGVYYWQGTVVRYETPTARDMEVIQAKGLSGSSSFFSYIGYATAVGQLFKSTTEQIVLGAPRADSSGLVLVIGLKDGVNYGIITKVTSIKFGSYFGAAVCVLDLNDDGLDDLLVGAPLFSVENSPGGDHGAVFVYTSQDEGTLKPASEGLFGLKKPWARFGQTIANAGKLLNLQYNSFIIGAPYEEDGKGAIYIYTGMAKTFSQRIAASVGMLGFGYGVSGNLDVDNNGYPDIAVGAYESNQAVLYLARPIVNVVTSVTFDKRDIDLEKDAYEMDGRHYPAIRMIVLLNYTGVEVPNSLEVEYIIKADFSKERARGRLVTGSSTVTELINKTVLQKDHAASFTYIVVFERTAKDLTSPFDCQLSFKLVNEESYQVKGLVPMLNVTKAKQIYTNVPFANKCDGPCDSDLQLSVIAATPTGEFLILGDERPFDISVTVTNAGEAAYQSVVEFIHPAQLRYRSLSQSSVSTSRRVSCFPSSPSDGLPESETGLKCDVGNPVYANQTVEFSVTFDAKKIREYQKKLKIVTTANTTSNEILPKDNKRTDRIPMIISTKIQLTGSSRPDQLQFEDKSESNTSRARQSTNDTLLMSGINNKALAGVAFEHYYDVKNNGPGMLPQTNFDLNIPHTRDKDQGLTTEIQVTMTTYRVDESSSISKACGLLPDDLKPFPVSKPPRATVNLVENDREPVDIDCSFMGCVSYRCPIKDLQARDSAVIKVAIQMGISDIMKDRIVYFFTEARLTTNMTNVANNKLEPDIRYHLVSTTLYPRDLVPSRFRIKLWVLLVAVFGGILGLIILSVTLYKCGFFKRRRPDDSQRLVDENDDNESQEANEEVDVKPPTAGGRDDVPGYGDNASNNANHAAYTAQSRTGPMYGQLSMIDDEVSEDGNNNNNNCEEHDKREIEEDRDEAGGVLVYSPFPYNHPPAPPVPDHPLPPDYDCNPLHWRPPPPPRNTAWSRDGYLLPVERRQL